LDRFEVVLDSYLAELFVEQLRDVLESSGFKETLRIHEPRVMEFQVGSHLLSVQIEEPAAHQRSLAVESETLDLQPLVSRAVSRTVVDVARRLTESLPWVGRDELCYDLQQLLEKRLA